jgi:Protein of unknown function (DUF3618)
MDKTAHEIELHIDRTRDRLGSNLKELEHKVNAATDWRGQFRARPYVVLGAACVGGALLGAVLNGRRGGFARGMNSMARPVSRTGVDARGQALELWENIQTALLGVGAARVKRYISELVPGFDEHVHRAEHRRAAAHDSGNAGWASGSR